MSTQESAQENKETTVEEMEFSRLENARKTVRKNMYWAMGLGVIPVPIIDLIGIAGFQVKAIKELSDLYDIPFDSHLFKNFLASLASGLGAPACGSLIAGSFLRSIPFVGTAVSLTATPLMAGAFTYAAGKVFIQHFESGGTFLDFDPLAVREFFRKEFEKGKGLAKKMATQKPETEKMDKTDKTDEE